MVKTYTNRGYTFLTFNNRGTNFVPELLKKDGYEVIGGCYERFIDCILDINGAIKYVKEKGFTEIVLKGHSYGCNKVVYYYNNKKDGT